MIHAAIVSRILMWYQQATAPVSRQDATATSSSSSSNDSATDPSNLPAENSKDLARATGFVVINTPASLGTFSIKDQVLQGKICQQVVLGELEKMSDLIELFSSHFPGTDGGARAGIANGLYTHAAGWIKDEYIRIRSDLRHSCNDIASNPSLNFPTNMQEDSRDINAIS
jgi:hypothetical protein